MQEKMINGIMDKIPNAKRADCSNGDRKPQKQQCKSENLYLSGNSERAVTYTNRWANSISSA